MTLLLLDVAVAMAGISVTLCLASLVARSPASQDQQPTTTQSHQRSPKPSLKLKRSELLEHARALGINTATWRNRARKTELLEAIQQHNRQKKTHAQTH